MTLSELDGALTKLKLDMSTPEGQKLRDKILALHGKSILGAKVQRCANCWLKEHGRCNEGCELFTVSDDPVEASKDYLSKPNDTRLFPFLFLYMIPVYEEASGQKDTVKKLWRAFKERWKQEKGTAEDLPGYL